MLDSLSEELGTLLPDAVVIEQEFCKESFILEGLREGGDARLSDLSVCQSDNSESFNVGKSLSNLDEAFVSDRIVVQVELAKFKLV